MNDNVRVVEMWQLDQPLLQGNGEHGNRNHDKNTFGMQPSRHRAWLTAMLIATENILLLVAFWYIWTRHVTGYSVDGEPSSSGG
jgi:hypothetical protein